MKKLATYLALTAVVANMGVAAVFAQETAVGTQQIECPTQTDTFGETVFENFRIGETSTSVRTVLSTNDAAYDPQNSALFGPGVTNSDVQTVQLTSDTPYSCGLETGSPVSVTVGATKFLSGTDELVTTDGTPYYALFSIITSNIDENGATLAEGSSLYSTVLNGQNNYFAGSTGSARNAGEDTNAYLINPTTNVPAAAATILSYTNGFEAAVTVDVDYNLALPANLAHTGTFTSTVTYSIL